MKIAFTICSNNYLSQAKTLVDSMVKHNPHYKFIIGLCDKKSVLVDYSFFQPHEIIEVEDLGIETFDWMILNYNVIELNTSVKPFYFKHLLAKYEDAEIVVYLDPDTKVYRNLDVLENELGNKSMMLTPHIVSPIPLDGEQPNEQAFLLFGIYNLGFFAVRPSDETLRILNWWGERLAVQCFDKQEQGLFVDQLPMNFVPLFSDEVYVSKNKGFNFAYWNMHERVLSKRGNEYFVNENTPLIFFHFSNFSPTAPLSITKSPKRFKLEEGSAMEELYATYSQELLGNKYFELKEVPCYYTVFREAAILKKKKRENKLKREFLRIVDQITGQNKKVK